MVYITVGGTALTPGLCARCLPGDLPCPKGSRIHLASLRCYWLSERTSLWPEAHDLCRKTPGGDLASAGSLQLLNFLHYSFPVWVLHTDVFLSSFYRCLYRLMFSLLFCVGLGKPQCGYGWREKGLRIRGGVLRWPWGRGDSGGRLSALDTNASSVKNN